jgi:hypothetical protein
MSVATVTELCNLALGTIGSNRLVDFNDSNEKTTQAIQCRLHYPNIRDGLLRSYSWNFAIAHLPLVSTWTTATGYTTNQYVWTNSLLYKCAVAHTSGTFATDLAAVKWVLITDRPPFGCWTYRYLLPADYLRKERIGGLEPHYIIESGYIWTHRQEVNINYVKQITDVTAFTDPMFIEVLVLRLAKRLLAALALSLSGAARQQLDLDLKTAEARARGVNSDEKRATGNQHWANARYGSGILGPSR